MLLKIGVLRLESTAFNLPALVNLIFNLYLLAGLVAFAISFFLWLKILAAVPLSYAYPMVSLGYVFVFLAAWLILGESLPPLRLIGLSLIIAGILFVAAS